MISLKFISKLRGAKLQLLLAVLITILITAKSSHFRWLGYERIPKPILDEYNYIWQGLSIREYGLPVGWVTFEFLYQKYLNMGKLDGLSINVGSGPTDLKSFKKENIPLMAIPELDWGEGKKQIFFAAPFFDHPPLGGLIFSQTIDKNTKSFQDVQPSQFRKGSLILAVINSILLFIFIYIVTSHPWIATLSVIIYSTIPSYVFGSRMSVLENVIPPFVLLHLILLTVFLKIKERINLNLGYLILFLSAFAGGLAALAKESAVGFLIGSLILLILRVIKEPSKKGILFFSMGAAIPIISYVAWGLWIHSEMFLQVLSTNAHRISYGPLKLVSTLPALRFKDFPIDGWWIWGFISFFLSWISFDRKYLPLLLPFTIHFLMVIFLDSPNYAWYYLGMVPFLASFTALNLYQIFKSPNLVLWITFFLIPLSSSFYWGNMVFRPPNNTLSYKILFLVLVLFVVLRLKFANKRCVHIVWTLFFLLLAYYLIKWNYQSIQFIIENWGKLPLESLPSF